MNIDPGSSLSCLFLDPETDALQINSRPDEISRLAESAIENTDSITSAADKKRSVSFDNETLRNRTVANEITSSSDLDGIIFKIISPKGRQDSHSPPFMQVRKNAPLPSTYDELRTRIENDLNFQLQRVPSPQTAMSLQGDSARVGAFIQKLLSENKIPLRIKTLNSDYIEVFDSLRRIEELKSHNHSDRLQKIEASYIKFKDLIQEQLRAAHLAEAAGMVAFILKNQNNLKNLKTLQAELLLDDFLLSILPFTTKEQIMLIVKLKDSKDADEIYSQIRTFCERRLLSKIKTLPTLEKKNPSLFKRLTFSNDTPENENPDCKIKRFEYLQVLLQDASENIQREFKTSFEGTESRAYLASVRDPRKSAPSPTLPKTHLP